MKLTEAIENLQTYLADYSDSLSFDFHDSIKLGIEALKMIELSRNLFKCPGQAPLPGETEEYIQLSFRVFAEQANAFHSFNA
ncbi:hypothetical protein ES703_76406 [subsurface metagenome]